jgi:hypothetical protein
MPGTKQLILNGPQGRLLGGWNYPIDTHIRLWGKGGATFPVLSLTSDSSIMVLGWRNWL